MFTECISNKYPPCIRIIVQETQAAGIKEGTLYIVTKEGGTIGREGNDHAIIIPELLISKVCPFIKNKKTITNYLKFILIFYLESFENVLR